MNKLNLLTAFVFSVTVSLETVAQEPVDPAALGGVISTTDVVVSDIPAYVAALKANSILASGPSPLASASTRPAKASAFST